MEMDLQEIKFAILCLGVYPCITSLIYRKVGKTHFTLMNCFHFLLVNLWIQADNFREKLGVQKNGNEYGDDLALMLEETVQ